MTPWFRRGEGEERRAYLHVGLQKTGTSFLQSHLWDSPGQLRARGVRMVPDGRGASYLLMLAVRDKLEEGSSPPRAFRALDELREAVARAEEPTLLLSQESLADATAEQAATLVDCFAGREVHVVVTARDVARQLPSMWQQRIKARRDVTFPAFLDLVRERAGVGRYFWAQQDLPTLLARWASVVPADRVHLVTVPPPGAPRDLLPTRFGSVVGVDFEELETTEARPNVSLDPVQAELVRRVNEVRQFEGKDHARLVKQLLSAQVLAPRRGEPARTPRDLAGWCRSVAEAQVAHVRDGGYDVVGDPADLLPDDDVFGPPLTAVLDSDVAAVAVQAVADLLDRHREVQAQNERLRRRLERRDHGPDPA